MLEKLRRFGNTGRETGIPSVEKLPISTEVKKEDLEKFLTKLREMTAELLQQTIAEKPRVSGGGKIFEVILTEQIEENRKKRKESKAERIWQKIREEGINQKNLNEFSKNIMNFSLPELQSMAASIDDLIREWDPAIHWFLHNLKTELKAMIDTKERNKISLEFC